MKQVLGIIASPRKLGNSEIMVKEISRALPCDHRLRLLRLSDFDLRPCRGCYLCLADAGRCPLEDDLYAVLEPIAAADGLIVAAPAYFLSANSGLKRLLDRGLAFYALIDALWGKPAVGVAIAGIEGKEGYTLLGVENFLKCLLATNKGCRVVYGALPGEALLEPRSEATALALANALFRPLLRRAFRAGVPALRGRDLPLSDRRRGQVHAVQQLGDRHLVRTGAPCSTSGPEPTNFCSVRPMPSHTGNGCWE